MHLVLSSTAQHRAKTHREPLLPDEEEQELAVQLQEANTAEVTAQRRMEHLEHLLGLQRYL